MDTINTTGSSIDTTASSGTSTQHAASINSHTDNLTLCNKHRRFAESASSSRCTCQRNIVIFHRCRLSRLLLWQLFFSLSRYDASTTATFRCKLIFCSDHRFELFNRPPLNIIEHAKLFLSDLKRQRSNDADQRAFHSL